MSIFRRRLMMGQEKASPYDDFGYIKKGKLYHFDGIDKGEDATRWTDIVSGEYFTYNSHSTILDNCVSMDGVGYLDCSGKLSVSRSTGTIEVCAERTDGRPSSAVLFFTPDTNRLAFAISAGGFCYSNGGSSNLYQLPKPTIWTASMSNERAIVNGVVYTTISNSNWSTNRNNATLGGRNYGTAYCLMCKVYSIRIYNRHLTESEMRHNIQVDNERFNLGLEL